MALDHVLRSRHGVFSSWLRWQGIVVDCVVGHLERLLLGLRSRGHSGLGLEPLSVLHDRFSDIGISTGLVPHSVGVDGGAFIEFVPHVVVFGLVAEYGFRSGCEDRLLRCV